jgi:hypothetical protein
MRLFGHERTAKVMDRLGMKEGEVITHKWITKGIERAQKKVEQNNFAIRKRQLEYDDVLNRNRVPRSRLQRQPDAVRRRSGSRWLSTTVSAETIRAHVVPARNTSTATGNRPVPLTMPSSVFEDGLPDRLLEQGHVHRFHHIGNGICGPGSPPRGFIRIAGQV